MTTNLLVYLGVVIAIVAWWYLNRTTPGLRLRAVGENPGAADSVGVNVKRFQYIHICIGCGIMGLGGYYMGLNMSGSFSSSCWINGYGWIAVALVIFANWNPALAILGTFVFGFFSTLRVSRQQPGRRLPRRPGLAGQGPHPAVSGPALPHHRRGPGGHLRAETGGLRLPRRPGTELFPGKSGKWKTQKTGQSHVAYTWLCPEVLFRDTVGQIG